MIGHQYGLINKQVYHKKNKKKYENLIFSIFVSFTFSSPSLTKQIFAMPTKLPHFNPFLGNDGYGLLAVRAALYYTLTLINIGPIC